MIRLIILTAILAGMAACASSAPPAAAPRAENVVATTSGDVVFAPAEAAAGTNDEEGIIPAVEAPKVALTAAPATEPRDEVICHREHVTGSHRTKKVCRLRSEIDATREETQKVLRRMGTQTGASSPSN